MCYFFKKYKYEFLTTVSTIVVSIFPVLMVSQNKQVLIVTIIGISLFVLILILFLRLRDKDLYFLSLTNRKNIEDWIGKGKFEYSKINKCFLITDSDSGFIFPKCFLWSDYKFIFEFKIVKDCLGAIIRSINLSNYVMLQLTLKKLRPHIRVNGGWYIWEETDISFPLSLDKWYKCLILCEKDIIGIKLYSNKDKILDRELRIPQGNIFFDFKKGEDDKSPIQIPFPINLEYGTVGFRNSGKEEALVRNILIEKI